MEGETLKIGKYGQTFQGVLLKSCKEYRNGGNGVKSKILKKEKLIAYLYADRTGQQRREN